MNKTIGIIIGSLRKDSYNRKVAEYVASLVPDGVIAQFIDIGSVPLYNADLEENPPVAWLTLREEIKSVDAVLFFTPEYNRTIPGALKNALDVGSRPYGQSAWNAKPGGIVSVSPGAIGAFGANHHLRQALTFLNIYTMQQPEAYVGNIASVMDENGKVVNPDTQKFFKAYLEAFIAWMNKF